MSGRSCEEERFDLFRLALMYFKIFHNDAY
jgi:hypothetical protein